MAIFSVQNVLPWGGSEELWAGAAWHLLARGHRVSAMVWLWPKPAPRVAELDRLGCNVHTFDLRRSLGRRVLDRLGVQPHDPFAWLDRDRPDLAVVSVVGHGGGLPEMSVCRARGVPYILVVQAASEPAWPGGDEQDRLYDAYVRAAAVCFVSQENRRLVERQFGRPLPNARMVRNPFNVRYDAAPPWPEEGNGFRLACVGRLDPHHKGQDLIIEVLGREKWRNRPVSATVVGQGGSERGLRRLAEWRKAAVRFQPFTDDVEGLWAGHHALLLPSRAEGLPLAMVEAQLCGRPAVVTPAAGGGEFVADGETGFVAAAPTVDLLDEALERAWQRRGEWQAMGAEAARRARRLVPPDPAAVFADFVDAIARGGAA